MVIDGQQVMQVNKSITSLVARFTEDDKNEVERDKNENGNSA